MLFGWFVGDEGWDNISLEREHLERETRTSRWRTKPVLFRTIFGQTHPLHRTPHFSLTASQWVVGNWWGILSKTRESAYV